MPYRHLPLIDVAEFSEIERLIGPSLERILSYYRQDGVVSITAIEDAMRTQDATAMVLPAHTLKGESLQFGAQRVAALALYLEKTARQCIEDRAPLSLDLIEAVADLRPMFHDTITELEQATSPAREIVKAKPAGRAVFGRRATS